MKKDAYRKNWFKAASTGVNMLNPLMKTKALKVTTNNERLANHSDQKNTIFSNYHAVR